MLIRCDGQFTGMVLIHVSYVEVAFVFEQVPNNLQMDYYKYIYKKKTAQTTADNIQ